MPTDSINDEILRIKRSLSAAQGNDLDRIVADLRSREANVVCLPARPYEPDQSAGCFPPNSDVLSGPAAPVAG